MVDRVLRASCFDYYCRNKYLLEARGSEWTDGSDVGAKGQRATPI